MICPLLKHKYGTADAEMVATDMLMFVNFLLGVYFLHFCMIFFFFFLYKWCISFLQGMTLICVHKGKCDRFSW